MKTILLTTISLAMAFTMMSCDHDGNTGNGANDPTDRFESDKAMKAGEHGNDRPSTSGTATADSSSSNSKTDSAGASPR